MNTVWRCIYHTSGRCSREKMSRSFLLWQASYRTIHLLQNIWWDISKMTGHYLSFHLIFATGVQDLVLRTNTRIFKRLRFTKVSSSLIELACSKLRIKASRDSHNISRTPRTPSVVETQFSCYQPLFKRQISSSSRQNLSSTTKVPPLRAKMIQV